MNCRFLCDDPAIHEAMLQRLRRDAESAQMSRMFRMYYRLVRPLVPLALRQLLQSRRRCRATAGWHLPAEFMEGLAASVAASRGLELIHPWPAAAPFAFVLTHDVETADGMRKALALADLEEELGFRSSFNVVPYKYKIDPGIVRELQTRGFEIGIHGYNHDGRLYFSERIFRRRAEGINSALQAHGAVGFRSPMVHRNLEWLQLLDVEYDSSCFDSDPFQAMPGGVGGIWPFIAGRFVELPYTLPQDHTLFVVLQERGDGLWRQKLRYVAERSGLALMLTHPDYLFTQGRDDVYRRFLADVRDEFAFWHALPREAARWWRRRDQSRLERVSPESWRIAGPAAAEGAPAQMRVLDGVLKFEHAAQASPAAVAMEGGR